MRLVYLSIDKDAFPHSHFCNKLADKLITHKFVSQTNGTPFVTFVSQKFVASKNCFAAKRHEANL
jgi:hypothetical protein